MEARLKIVLGDIAIMTMILEMTDCEKTFVQKNLQLLSCEDKCTKKKYVKFSEKLLQQKLGLLKSSASHDLIQNNFNDLFAGIEGLEGVEFIQLGADQSPMVNKTKFNNPPTPRTKVPGNPCNYPYAGAPSAADKNAAKCTIKKSPQCYKLQERFLLIQSGIQDERDQLQLQIEELNRYCTETEKLLDSQILDFTDTQNGAQTKLAAAMEKEAKAGEEARTTAQEHDGLNADLKKQMKTCSDNYINFETELCALKKIRGELYKMKGSGHSSFFQDCKVSTWNPEECTKTCKGGDQKLARNVMTHPDGGAACLPLSAMRRCNQQPCPVNCVLEPWSGWSKCSAECGGGLTQRLREVKVASKHEGTPCGKTSEAEPCNLQACERDCELSDWTKWSGCSKDCDGGTRKRQKFVVLPAVGQGKCADSWAPERLEYKGCNRKRCVIPAN